MIAGLGPKNNANFRASLSWFKLRITMKPGVQKYKLEGKKKEESVHEVQVKLIMSGFKIRTQIRVKADITL